MLVHPLFSEYGGAEKVLLDMFRAARKKYKTEMYTLFYKDYLKNEDNIFYGSLEEPKLKKLFGYKVNPFNRKAIKHLGKQLLQCFHFTQSVEVFLLSLGRPPHTFSVQSDCTRFGSKSDFWTPQNSTPPLNDFS